MVKYKVTVARNAYQMLDNHIFFLAKVSTKAAHSLRKTFITTIKSLDYNPERYPLWLPQFELPKPYRKILINERYFILFYIDGNNIFILIFPPITLCKKYMGFNLNAKKYI